MPRRPVSDGVHVGAVWPVGNRVGRKASSGAVCVGTVWPVGDRVGPVECKPIPQVHQVAMVDACVQAMRVGRGYVRGREWRWWCGRQSGRRGGKGAVTFGGWGFERTTEGISGGPRPGGGSRDYCHDT